MKNDFWPNGQCDACGCGLNEVGSCVNNECNHGTGPSCVLTGCHDPYHATAGGLDLCIYHFDQIKDNVG